jgi:hypothetical protein
MALESLIFLVVGLGILVYEAHRQFNEPSYPRPSGEDDEVLYALLPSEIRSRAAYVSAELVYIASIVALYLLFLYSDAVQRVAEYLIHFVGRAPVTGGGAPPPVSGGEVGEATGVLAESGLRAEPGTIERAAAPFVVAVTLVAALRLPLVNRLEAMLRGFAHRLFGIPRIPDRLRRKIADTPVDLAALEQELGDEHRAIRYGPRVARILAAAEAAQPQSLDLAEFRRDLEKLAAFQIWVRDLRLWPSAEFRTDFTLFRTIYDPLASEIGMLLKDLELLANPSIDRPGEPGPTGDEDREIAIGRDNMRRELWDLKVRQGARLARRASAMMALFDQHSTWPEADRPGAATLRRFLAAARSADDARTFQINLAIMLVLVTTLANAIVGYVHAGQLERLAIDFGVAVANGPYNPQFDPLRNAGLFAFSAILVYGLSIWVALDYRSRLRRKGRWPSFFGGAGRIPPLTQIAPVCALAFLAVFAAHFIYAYGQSVEWEFVRPAAGNAAGEALWWENVRRQFHLSLIFALVGGVHGAAVAVMMDLERPQFESPVWITTILVYVVLMAGLGLVVGHYFGSTAFLGEPSTPAVAEMRPVAQRMRELLYAFDLALIAALTSLAITSLIRPQTAPTGTEARIATGPRP